MAWRTGRSIQNNVTCGNWIEKLWWSSSASKEFNAHQFNIHTDYKLLIGFMGGTEGIERIISFRMKRWALTLYFIAYYWNSHMIQKTWLRLEMLQLSMERLEMQRTQMEMKIHTIAEPHRGNSKWMKTCMPKGHTITFGGQVPNELRWLN